MQNKLTAFSWQTGAVLSGLKLKRKKDANCGKGSPLKFANTNLIYVTNKKNLEAFSVRKCVCYIYVSGVSSSRLGPQWITICQESCHDGTSVP